MQGQSALHCFQRSAPPAVFSFIRSVSTAIHVRFAPFATEMLCCHERQQLCERTQVPAAFNPVAITPEPEAAASAPAVAERAGVIEIEFATGGRMRITGTVDAPTVMALMKALAKGKRRR